MFSKINKQPFAGLLPIACLYSDWLQLFDILHIVCECEFISISSSTCSYTIQWSSLYNTILFHSSNFHFLKSLSKFFKYCRFTYFYRTIRIKLYSLNNISFISLSFILQIILSFIKPFCIFQIHNWPQVYVDSIKNFHVPHWHLVLKRTENIHLFF